MSANECARFKDQYTDLRRTAKENAPPAKFASMDAAMRKNRFKNILPYDSTRVHLEGKDMETYINASYLQGTGKSFIAAQGPLSNTIEDFWRMIVEKRCRIIVMLTKCNEQGRIKCEKYWPNINTRVKFGDYEITNLGEIKTGGIVKRNLRVVTPAKDEMTVDHYHFVRWPDHGVPSTTSTFLRLHGMVMAQHKASGKDDPILAHCSAGVGRTGTFIGFDNIITESDRKVDIYSCVMKMRQQRVDMVQTCAQYQLLHKLMLETYLFSDSDCDEADLPGIIADKTWEVEFEQLKEAESIASYGLEHGRGTRITIIRQPEDTEWVTLNASFVEAYSETINFIASEGPAPSTIEYFLRAVWDNDVNVIVMLNNPDEESKAADKQYSTYWPQKTNVPKTYNNVTIELIEERVVLGITERVLRLTSKEKKTRDIRQLRLTEWSTELQKEKRDDVLELINRLQSTQVGDTVNVMVHCTDGLGRTGVFIAVANIIERLQAENRIDVFRAVKDLRDIRPGMVNTLAQYKLCYDLASYFNSQRNPYVNKPQQKTEVKADPLYENL